MTQRNTRSAFIKLLTDFKTVFAAAAIDYSVPLESAGGETGTITVPGAVSAGYAGNWLCMDGRIWIIDKVEPNEGVTEITVADPATAFSRPAAYGGGGVSIGAFIASTLAGEWKNQSDIAYAMPYLEIANTDSSEFVAPEVSEDGLFVLADYMASVRANNDVRCEFSFSGDTLNVSISHIAPSTHVVMPDDGKSQIVRQTYGKSSVAKVTVFKAGVGTAYYLATDGTVSTSVPSARANGEWSVVTCNDSDDPATIAAGEFAKNAESHSVEFLSSDYFRLYDVIRIRVDGAVVDTKITCVTASADDDRYSYQCGKLPNTLTKIVKATSSISALGGVAASGGTITGATGVDGTLSARGKIILSSQSCGYTLPTDDYTAGRLFFLKV